MIITPEVPKITTKKRKNKKPPSLSKNTHWGALALISLLTLIGYLLIVSEAAAHGLETQKLTEALQAPVAKVEPEKPQPPTVAPAPSPKETPVPTDKEAMKKYIISVFTKAGYKDPQFAVRVAMCESGLNESAIGDGGKSYGLWQWHLPSHPSITKEQALDPVWATERAAKYFVAGSENLWTCARMLK